MTSLPERLRSRAKVEQIQYRDTLTSGLMTEAADELDRRAAQIQRLTTGITAMRLRGEMALGDEEQPPLDPETPGFRPGMTLTEDPTKAPEIREPVGDVTVREALDVLLTRMIEAARRRWYAG